jgi:predicted alpha/beta hydrolase family esterase
VASFLILHGYQGSGPQHWQTWLAGRLRRAGAEVAYPALPSPDAPVLEAWRAALERELRALSGPPVVVCHSLACVLWLHHCAQPVLEGGCAERVLLVAPPSPEGAPRAILPFFPVPLEGDAVARAARETVLVCGHDDPYCPEGAAAVYGGPLGLAAHVLPRGGHVNVEAGYGPWPEVEAWALGGGDGFGREEGR